MPPHELLHPGENILLFRGMCDLNIVLSHKVITSNLPWVLNRSRIQAMVVGNSLLYFMWANDRTIRQFERVIEVPNEGVLVDQPTIFTNSTSIVRVDL